MMPQSNAKPSSLARAVSKLDPLPQAARSRLLTLLFTRQVRFAGTGSVRFESLSHERAVLHLANRPRVRNHIGTIHAAAMALLAETASGAVFGMNVPADRVPLLKSMHIDYLRRAEGALRAEATLSAHAGEQIRSSERGELLVPVTLTDAEGQHPVQCEMLWAWVPKRHKDG